jgi:hypothetical protein
VLPITTTKVIFSMPHSLSSLGSTKSISTSRPCGRRSPICRTTSGLSLAQVAALQGVQFSIADLGHRGYLGLAFDSRWIQLDANAAGYGWSLDLARGPAAGQVDLMSAVMHELGHVLGYQHVDDIHDVMFSSLSPGIRPNLLAPVSSVASHSLLPSSLSRLTTGGTTLPASGSSSLTPSASQLLMPSLHSLSNGSHVSSSSPFTGHDRLFSRLGEEITLLPNRLTPRVDVMDKRRVTSELTSDRRVSRVTRYHADAFDSWDPSEETIASDVLEILGRAHKGESTD